jgi:6-phosphogluconolactonase
MTRIVRPRSRRGSALLAALVIALLGMFPRAASAQSSGMLFIPLVSADPQAVASAETGPGAVFVMTNQTGGNAVAVYRRLANGMLEAAGTVPTGGLGTGAGIGSQGSLVLSDDGRWLFAVNPGSDDLSVFAVQPSGLALTDRVASGGSLPISVTYYKDLVYVLNAGGAGNISGFRLDNHGRLTPIADSTRFLSNNGVGSAPGPAQVSFSPDGSTLVVTEKATNLLLTYSIDGHGIASGPVTVPSSGPTPFGFAFTQQGTLVVSEAFGGAVDASAVSSYVLSHGDVQLVSGSVPTGQTAACWIVVTKNGKYAYSANAGSGSVSAYGVNSDGSLSLIDGRAGVTGEGTGPIDMAVSHNGQYIYVLNGRVPSISGFAVQADGRLEAVGTFAGLPAGAVGIAAW